MAFKSGHEDITHIKANASFDYQDTQSVTANGIRGLITMTNSDSTWSIEPMAMCGVLVKAIQELSTRIEELENG